MNYRKCCSWNCCLFNFGAIIGLINGFLSIYLGISSLIVTLGMLFILRGAVYLYTGQRPISDELYSDFSLILEMENYLELSLTLH